jgi:hypothetical protein
MVRAVLYVETRPASPEREDEYNRWYDEVHLGEVVGLTGVTGARRYSTPEGSYVALYDLDVDDPSSMPKTLAVAMRDGRISMSDVLQLDPPPTMRILQQIAEHRG